MRIQHNFQSLACRRSECCSSLFPGIPPPHDRMDQLSYDATGRTRAALSRAGARPNDAQEERPGLPADAEALKRALSEVTHDLNNPLAIISGNAQLLLELARMLDLDPDVAKPIQDIEEASQRLAATVDRLNELKETLRDDPGVGGNGV